MDAKKYDALPENIKEILGSYNDNKNVYKECERIINKLEKNGYTADYDLSGDLFNIEKL